VKTVSAADLISSDDDPIGLPTIGYGHLCADKYCSDVPYPKPLSLANGQKLLQSDITVRPKPYLTF
jgi:hypothetical protein